MKNEFTELFSKINNALFAGQSDAGFIEDSMFALMGLIIDAGDQPDFQTERNNAVMLLEKLEGLASGDKLLQPYLCAVVLYFKDDYNSYLTAIETYIRNILRNTASSTTTPRKGNSC